MTDRSLVNVPGNLEHFLVHSRVPGEIAHQMALVPLGWLALLYLRGVRPGTAWWLLASAFAVSWLADTWADIAPHEAWAASLVYPVSQAALIGGVLMPRRRDAWAFLALLVVVGIVGALKQEHDGPDLMLRAVAFLGVFAIVWFRPELPASLRWCLFVYFGLGWVLWVYHVEDLRVATWYPYQVTRLFGLLLFCKAAVRPQASFRVVR